VISKLLRIAWFSMIVLMYVTCFCIVHTSAQSVYSVAAPTLRYGNGQVIASHEFPPVGSEERFWACLVSSDPINRCGVLRWETRDRMIEFTLLPYAPIFYRGAPASLADIPPGTMVEVWAFRDEVSSLPRNVMRLSDAFSMQRFSDISYKVESIDLDRGSFTAIATKRAVDESDVYKPAQPTNGSISATFEDQPVSFSFNGQTKWYIGDRIASKSDLAVGQQINVNFIRKFYDGPPLITRCTEVWLDEESHSLAARNQLAAFQSYQRDRGFPLRVDAVDDAKKQVWVTLLETGWNDIHKEWKPDTTHDFSASTTSLRSWEPNGGQGGPDRMFGVHLLEITETSIGYGNGGAKMLFEVPLMYEAYRVGTIIKLYPNNHPVPILPIEERMPKEFDTFLRP
jgi:hypothetical protein